VRRLGLYLLLCAFARTAHAQDSTAARPVRITYLTTASAYVDAGREDGLEEGDSLRVVRTGTQVGLLRVPYLSSHQASCEILSDPEAILVGDTLTVTRRVAATAPASGGQTTAVAARRPSPTRDRNTGLHGRFGVRYLGVWRKDGVGGRLSQPWVVFAAAAFICFGLAGRALMTGLGYG